MKVIEIYFNCMFDKPWEQKRLKEYFFKRLSGIAAD